MRLACVVEAYPPHVGGSEVRMSELLKRLPKDWEIHVVTPRFDGYPPLEEQGNITVHRVGGYDSRRYFLDTDRPLTDCVRFGLQAASRLRELGPFDVGVFGEWNLLHFVLSEASLRSPKLVDWCEVLAGRIGGLKGVGEGLLEAYLARRADHHTAINSKVADDLVCKHGVSRSKVSVVPNGVPPEMFSHTPPEKRGDLVLFVGRLKPHKQPELVLEAAKMLPQYIFHVVGAGDPRYVGSLKERAPPNVVFLGQLSKEELLEEYRRAWVLALPSRREGSSIAALEAMANHTPVVTVRSPLNNAVYDVVEHGLNGLVAENTLEGFVCALKSVLEDEGLHRRLSQGAYRTAAERCWDRLAARFRGVVESVVERAS